MTRRPHRASKVKGQFAWSAVRRSRSLIASASTVIDPLVLGADWGVSASQIGTLKSILGWISVAGSGASGDDIINMFIVKQDINVVDTDASLDPTQIQNYVDEDVLWTGVWQSPVRQAASIENASGYTMEINIKAQRKIRGDDRIILCSRTAANEVTMSMILRSLVKVP